MTFWQWLTENKTKILGLSTTLVAGLLSLIAMGLFDKTPDDPALMSEHSLRWLTILLSLANMALGGGTVAAGVANTTSTRVAEAQAKVASAMQTAINTQPPGGAQP